MYGQNKTFTPDSALLKDIINFGFMIVYEGTDFPFMVYASE